MTSRAAAYTGERLPAAEGGFAVDLARHLAAYRFAAARARGRTVLDAGCGEGYGAARLAEVAASSAPSISSGSRRSASASTSS